MGSLTFGKRLKKARKDKGLTQKELAALVFLGESTISFYEADKRQPKFEILQKLADVLEVEAGWLLNGTSKPDPVLPPDAFPLGEVVSIPIYGEICAGRPMLAREEIIGYEYVPKQDVKNGDYFFLRVKGDSMTGARIYPGDLVLVRRQETLDDGQIGVFLVKGEEATIKRFYFRNGDCLLVPENPAYEPQIYKARHIRIIGEVVEVKFKLNGRK